jgi:hypothetical protein
MVGSLAGGEQPYPEPAQPPDGPPEFPPLDAPQEAPPSQPFDDGGRPIDLEPSLPDTLVSIGGERVV